jgi:hypothetical protein
MAVTINASTSAGLISTADTSGILQLQTANTTALTVDASQNVGIGTSSPTTQLQIFGDGTQPTISLTRGTTGTGKGAIAFGIASANSASIRVNSTANSAANAVMTFAVADSSGTNQDRMVIDTSGNLGLGVTPSTWSTGSALEINAKGNAIWGVGSSNINVLSNAYYNGGFLYASTGAASNYQQASGAHKWLTVASGTINTAITFTQAMTLDASGNLGIGTTTPSSFDGSADNLVVGTTSGNNGITIAAGTSSASTLNFADGTAGGAQYTGYIDYQHSGNYMRFGTNNGTERMRIGSTGDIYWGCTGVVPASMYFTPDANGGSLVSSGSSGTKYVFYFQHNNGTVGYISSNSGGVNYASTSDYRLKNTIAPMTGALAKVALLKPCTYKWNYDNSDGQGFIAHELQEFFPDAVVGQKDEVDANGKIKPQGIDTSFLVATLTAAIQEQQAIIETLKADVAALKG